MSLCFLLSLFSSLASFFIFRCLIQGQRVMRVDVDITHLNLNRPNDEVDFFV